MLLTMLAAVAAVPVAPMDYGRAESWLCRPEAPGPCAADLATTDIVSGAKWERLGPKTANFDCFYVYPTVSLEPTDNASGRVSGAERYAAEQQFGPFGQVCRQFAPLYRQVTVRGLVTGGGDGKLAFRDVAAAWNHYLKHDNEGRGILLIGHSQGARRLRELLATIAPESPVAKRIIAAYVIGNQAYDTGRGNVTVPTGPELREVPGPLPLCQSAAETSCVVAYVTFAANSPPPKDSRFGRTPAGQAGSVACTSPAELIGDGEVLEPMFPTRPRSAMGRPLAGAAALAALPTANWSATGGFSGKCVRGADGASYFQVTPHSPVAAQTLTTAQSLGPTWGLHLIDMNVTMGNLVRLARAQALVWQRSQSRR